MSNMKIMNNPEAYKLSKVKDASAHMATQAGTNSLKRRGRSRPRAKGCLLSLFLLMDLLTLIHPS